MDELEQMVDLVLTRNLIDAVTQSGHDVLNQCHVSLLRFLTGNLLMITCYSEDFMPLELYTALPEIARYVHREHGKTHICLRHYQKQLITRWDSDNLLRSFEEYTN